jgi:hypothetical protein
MVWVKLGTFEFEAEKFETRTMPTPDLKGKEIIYWIKIVTEDKRFATDLSHFMEGAPRSVDLRVPGALISARTEIESFHKMAPRPLVPEETSQLNRQVKGGEILSQNRPENDAAEPVLWRFEIILRRTLPGSPEKQTQSPYG